MCVCLSIFKKKTMKKIYVLILVMLLLIGPHPTKAISKVEVKSSTKISQIPLIEGYFYRVSSEGYAIYWCVNGMLHPILYESTFHLLFDNMIPYMFNVTTRYEIGPTPIAYPPMGLAIPQDACLVDIRGTFYVRMGDKYQTHYSIRSQQEMDIYHLNRASVVTDNSYNPANVIWLINMH